MNQLKISTRLTLLIGMLISFMTALGGLGLLGIGKSNDALKTVYEDRTVPAGQLAALESLLLRNRLALASSLANPIPAVLAANLKATQTNMDQFDTVWKAYLATYLTPDEEKLAKAFGESRKRYLQEGLTPALAALRANNLGETQRLLDSQIESLYAPVKQGLDALMQLQMDVAKLEFDAAQTRYGAIRMASMAGLALSVVFGIAFGMWMSRSIARQLGAEPAEAASNARSVAAGDLSVEIALKPGDSTSLMARLKTMQEGLQQVVASVRGSAENVAAASAEIAQGNHDLSGRTERQASALQETAASMEQLICIDLSSAT